MRLMQTLRAMLAVMLGPEGLYETARRFGMDRAGVMNPRGIITLAIAAFFVAIVVPLAINQTFLVDTSTWGAVAGLWILLPLGILAVVIFAFLPRGGGGNA